MNASEYERLQLVEGKQAAYEKATRENRAREALARAGYRLLHRRGQQYWVMPAVPETLDQIERWLEKSNGKVRSKKS
jgi:hypothetical protein